MKDLNKWKNTPCSQIAILNIVKMPILSKLIYDFNTVPIISLEGIFVETDKLILKFI